MTAHSGVIALSREELIARREIVQAELDDIRSGQAEERLLVELSNIAFILGDE